MKRVHMRAEGAVIEIGDTDRLTECGQRVPVEQTTSLLHEVRCEQCLRHEEEHEQHVLDTAQLRLALIAEIRQKMVGLNWED